MPEFNIPDPDPRDLDGTQPGKPIKIPAPIPQDRPVLPPRGRGRSPEPSRRDTPGKRKNDERKPPADPRRSGLYLPAWSLALMLLIVLGVTFIILLIVFGLGGRFEASGEPVVVIITALPSSTPPLPQFEPTLPAATLPGINPAVPQFPLEGPTLVPVELSPTPITIALDVQIRPTGQGVNLRPGPSTEGTPLAQVGPDDRFVVIGGPEEDGQFTWWQVQDISNPIRIGWIAASLIEAVAPGQE